MKHVVAAAIAAALIGGGLIIAAETKVDVCHIPPGNPANAHTITIAESAVPAHLAHGDYLGACRVNPSPSR